MGAWPLFFAVVVSFVTSASGFAQEAFYKGKVIRIVTGASAGGGLDTYSRTIARHMRKHIPGDPSIVVENMPGAGGLIMVNHLAKVAKPDGLTIGNFIGDLMGLRSLMWRSSRTSLVLARSAARGTCGRSGCGWGRFCRTTTTSPDCSAFLHPGLIEPHTQQAPASSPLSAASLISEFPL